MKHGEAWLLETLSMFRLPVAYMTRSERPMNEWLNRGYHDLSNEELLSTLTQMFQRGEIDAYYDDDFECPASLAEFVAGLGNPDCTLHCGVTQTGGMRWEQQANPDWDRYFEDSSWNGDTAELRTKSLGRLEELVANAPLLWRCHMTLDENQIIEITPWEPFTWKKLPAGLLATVSYVEIPFVPKSRDEIVRDHRESFPRELELRNWATSICGNAYV